MKKSRKESKWKLLPLLKIISRTKTTQYLKIKMKF